MSGPAPLPEVADDLVCDEGVLLAQACAEFGGYRAVERCGGVAILRWRGHYLSARALGLAAAPELDTGAQFTQIIVRISRGQAATALDLTQAFAALAPSGRLVVVGANGLGAATWIDKVAAIAGEPLRVITRAKSRCAIFTPASPRAWPQAPSLGQAIFSGGELDRGTAVLVDYLRDPAQPSTPTPAGGVRRLADLGCGAGYLGLAAARLHAQAQAVLLDADHHAVRSAEARARGERLQQRVRCVWWDAYEALPEADLDLVLINPPAHVGASVDLSAAVAMIRAGTQALSAGGRMLVVANQRLPYERDLGRIAPWRLAQQRDGYKIIEVRGA